MEKEKVLKENFFHKFNYVYLECKQLIKKKNFLIPFLKKKNEEPAVPRVKFPFFSTKEIK